MQRIERYGVIALVFLLVTIVAVSLWGERKKTGGWFSFLRGDSKASRVEELVTSTSPDELAGEPAFERPLSEDEVPMSGPDEQGAAGHAFKGPGTAPDAYRDILVDREKSLVPPEDINDVVVHPDPPTRTETLVPQPAVASAREYTIRPGDTLSQIAQRELGTKNRWRDIVELNPGLDPARLRVGTKIRLSGAVAVQPPTPVRPQPKVASAKPAEKPAAVGRSYTVRAGDTLSQIAQRELGTQSRWRELVELNPGLDPAKLLVGTSIRLPGGEAPRDTRVARAESAPAVSSASSSNASRSKVR
jgi:nucleoid-associated protein YgaU